MNSKTAKKLRRFAKDKELDPKKVKRSFKRLSKEEQKVVLRDILE